MNSATSRKTTTGLIGFFCTLALAAWSFSTAVLAEDENAKRSSMYFPNTEELRPDEMRVTALGTGLPTPLTRAQKSTAWMVELGNGDVFLFDIGTGSMENLFGLRPDFSRIDRLFLSHLHSDHFGDLDAFIVGSWLSGRYTPLHVYGGTGETQELKEKPRQPHLILILQHSATFAMVAELSRRMKGGLINTNGLCGK